MKLPNRYGAKFDPWPEDVVEHLLQLTEEKECSDNFRIARLWDSDELEAYAKAQRKGCCGYFDAPFVGKDEMTYLIGFNYGH